MTFASILPLAPCASDIAPGFLLVTMLVSAARGVLTALPFLLRLLRWCCVSAALGLAANRARLPSDSGQTCRTSRKAVRHLGSASLQASPALAADSFQRKRLKAPPC
jgi:hypothetical protein